MDVDQDELISSVCGITGVSPTTARQILESSSWNAEEAVRLYYESQEPEEEPEMGDADIPSQSGSAGRSQQASGSGSSRPPQNQSRLRTIKDIQSDARGDDSDDDDEDKQDFFAGGEKSALAVQNPNSGSNNSNRPSDHFNNIMNQARQNRPRPGSEEEGPTNRPSNFGGRAQTLGGDDAPSQLINDGEDDLRSTSSPRVTRILHLWQDGFSVDDGELYRFDDPANASTLALINQGRAPLALLGVQPGQEVDLQLNPHKDEKYVQAQKKYKPFTGSGQRLGSPTPGASGSTETRNIDSSASTAKAAASSSATPSVAVDDSQPIVTLQIRLGDGTRLQSRFNTSHTIGDVYEFVAASSAESRSRSFALMTTFPSKELSDTGVKLGDLADFKRGGVVVQKWT